MVTLRQLHYLSALAEHGHFGRAADACAITQPALSMQIRELERTLGVRLIERLPGAATLTDIGREIVRRGDDVLAGARDLVDFARHRATILSGRLSLGAIPSVAPYLLPTLLPLLQQRHPQLRLELRETQTRALVQEVRGRSLDAALLALPLAEPDLDQLALFDDPFLLAVPASDPLASAAPIDAAAIDPARLILLEDGHCLRDQALAFCAVNGRGAPTAFGASSLATVMQMVAAGYGTTLLPQLATALEGRDRRVALLRFGEPQPKRRIGLVFRKTSPRRADFEALGEAIKTCV